MELVVTCNHCGTQNRVGKTPRGQRAVCGNCRSVLGSVEPPPSKKRSEKISGTAWAWLAILSIALIAWITETSRTSSQKEAPKSPSTANRPLSSYTKDYSTSSRQPYVSQPSPRVFKEPEQPLPVHGKITWHSSGDPVAPLEIRSSRGSNYVVKLADYYSGRAVLSVFVHGGSSVNLDVPLGTYSIKYASGETWYGSEHLFGPDTSYTKADTSFDFRVIGNQVSGYTLTLYKVVDGNLHTSPILPDEF